MTAARTSTDENAGAREGPSNGRPDVAERSHLAAGFGLLLADTRRARGLTQRRLAALAEVHFRTVQRLEYGQRRPRADLVRVLALVLASDDADRLEAEMVAAAGDSIRPAWGGKGGRRARHIAFIERRGQTWTENREWAKRRMAEIEENRRGWQEWARAMASDDAADLAQLHGLTGYPRGVDTGCGVDVSRLDIAGLARTGPPPHRR